MNILNALFAQPREPSSIVAYQNGNSKSWAHWTTNLAALQTELESKPTGSWAIYCSDGYEFSIAVVALWLTGRVPVLAPDTSASTIATMTDKVSGFIGDFPDALAWRADIESLSLIDIEQPENLVWQLTLCTSGSSGDAVMVSKSQLQVESEVHVQTDLWRDICHDSIFAATVSHQHIYGLLFKVLIPMVLQRPFIAELLTNPRTLLQVAQSHRSAVWIASPAQLKRLNADMFADLNVDAIKLIISSGGLLIKPDAADVERIFGEPAVEIYGSTETGGIAMRRQYAAESTTYWRVLPEVAVQVSADGVLQVRSPFAGPDLATTGDLAVLHDDGSFSLSGRADKIVKLEEKRISLTAVERQLEQLPEVQSARVFVLPGARETLAAVVVLAPAAKDDLLTAGRAALSRTLKLNLAKQLENFSIPRRFRFVEDMPMTAQGKTRIADLVALFEHSPRRVLPVVNSVQLRRDGATLSLWVPPDLEYFPGHFPDFPVLPGVVQLLWVRHFAKLHVNFTGDVSEMKQVKFKSIIRPGQTLTMTLDVDRQAPSRQKLKYSIANDEAICASGTLLSTTH